MKMKSATLLPAQLASLVPHQVPNQPFDPLDDRNPAAKDLLILKPVRKNREEEAIDDRSIELEPPTKRHVWSGD
jgi:hypothetical protein